MQKLSAKEKKLIEIEKLLTQCEADVKFLKATRKKLKDVNKNINTLITYFEGEYVKDYDDYASGKIKGTYRALNQDAIRNAMSDQYQEKLQLAKDILNSLGK